MYDVQHCCICRLSESTMSEDAGIEPRTVAITAFAVRRSNHTRLHLINTQLDLIHTRLDLIHNSARYHPDPLDLIHSKIKAILHPILLSLKHATCLNVQSEPCWLSCSVQTILHNCVFNLSHTTVHVYLLSIASLNSSTSFA